MESPQIRPVNNFPHCAKDIKQKCGTAAKAVKSGHHWAQNPHSWTHLSCPYTAPRAPSCLKGCSCSWQRLWQWVWEAVLKALEKWRQQNYCFWGKGATKNREGFSLPFCQWNVDCNVKCGFKDDFYSDLHSHSGSNSHDAMVSGKIHIY